MDSIISLDNVYNINDYNINDILGCPIFGICYDTFAIILYFFTHITTVYILLHIN